MTVCVLLWIAIGLVIACVVGWLTERVEGGRCG